MTTKSDYRITVEAKAPAQVAFRSITTTEALTAWWSPAFGSGLAGGELRFPMVADQPPLAVRVEESNEPTTVRWTVIECSFMPDWVGTEPTFTITPIDDSRCQITFEHRGLDDTLPCKEMCSRSWDHFIGTSLRELVEGGPAAPNRSPRDLARRASEERASTRTDKLTSR